MLWLSCQQDALRCQRLHATPALAAGAGTGTGPAEEPAGAYGGHAAVTSGAGSCTGPAVTSGAGTGTGPAEELTGPDPATGALPQLLSRGTWPNLPGELNDTQKK